MPGATGGLQIDVGLSILNDDKLRPKTITTPGVRSIRLSFRNLVAAGLNLEP